MKHFDTFQIDAFARATAFAEAHNAQLIGPAFDVVNNPRQEVEDYVHAKGYSNDPKLEDKVPAYLVFYNRVNNTRAYYDTEIFAFAFWCENIEDEDHNFSYKQNIKYHSNNL